MRHAPSDALERGGVAVAKEAAQGLIKAGGENAIWGHVWLLGMGTDEEAATATEAIVAAGEAAEGPLDRFLAGWSHFGERPLRVLLSLGGWHALFAHTWLMEEGWQKGWPESREAAVGALMQAGASAVNPLRSAMLARANGDRSHKAAKLLIMKGGEAALWGHAWLMGGQLGQEGPSARQAIAAAGEAAFAPLCAVLDNVWAAEEAVKALGRLSDPQVVPALMDMLAHSTFWQARISAAEALGARKEMQALPLLREIAAKAGEKDEVRRAATLAADAMERRGEEREALEGDLSEESIQTRQVSNHAFQLGFQETAKALRALHEIVLPSMRVSDPAAVERDVRHQDSARSGSLSIVWPLLEGHLRDEHAGAKWINFRSISDGGEGDLLVMVSAADLQDSSYPRSHYLWRVAADLYSVVLPPHPHAEPPPQAPVQQAGPRGQEPMLQAEPPPRKWWQWWRSRD